MPLKKVENNRALSSSLKTSALVVSERHTELLKFEKDFQEFLINNSLWVSTYTCDFLYWVFENNLQELLNLSIDKSTSQIFKNYFSKCFMLIVTGIAAKQLVIDPFLKSNFRPLSLNDYDAPHDEMECELDYKRALNLKNHSGMSKFSKHSPNIILGLLVLYSLYLLIIKRRKIPEEILIAELYFLRNSLLVFFKRLAYLPSQKFTLNFLNDILKDCNQAKWAFYSVDDIHKICVLNIRQYSELSFDTVMKSILQTSKKYNLEFSINESNQLVSPTHYRFRHSAAEINTDLKARLLRFSSIHLFKQHIHQLIQQMKRYVPLEFAWKEGLDSQGFSTCSVTLTFNIEGKRFFSEDVFKNIFKNFQMNQVQNKLIIHDISMHDECVLDQLNTKLYFYFCKQLKVSNDYSLSATLSPDAFFVRHSSKRHNEEKQSVESKSPEKVENKIIHWPSATYNADAADNKVYPVSSSNFSFIKRFVTLDASAFGNVSQKAYEHIEKEAKKANHVTHKHHQGIIFLDNKKPMIVRGQRFFAAAKLKVLGEEVGDVRVFSPACPEVSADNEELYVFNKVFTHSHTR